MRYRKSGDLPVIIHYDRIARNDRLWEQLAPEAVLCWGEPPTSKLLRQRLGELDLPGYLIGPGKRGINPIHGRIQWAGTRVAEVCRLVGGQSGDYGTTWQEADTACEAALSVALAEPHPLFEGDVHRVLGSALPDGATVFFASSLAIRDADWFMPAGEMRFITHSQRGANGIDGTLSQVRGIAAGSGRPAFLVTGDLAFLHDSNGLLGAAADDPGVCVILLNNNGGGIFEFLPIADVSENFERLFATPQTVDFKRLVEAHGGTCLKVDSADWLGEVIDGWNGRGLLVAEIGIDRKASRGLHKTFLNL